MKFIKEFLKPEWRKMVLTIIFLLFAIFGSPFIPLSVELPGRSVPVFAIILLWPSFIFTCIPTKGGVICRLYGIEIYIGYFITILYLYFLSCLIVWIYNKVKKK
jgi:hypothetical protein